MTASDETLQRVRYDWPLWSRKTQLPPDGDWRYWLILAGRGFGKTRAGAEWVRAQAAAGAKRIALIGPTVADVRDVMVEGESGLLRVTPPWERPSYQPSRRRVVWPNGDVPGALWSFETLIAARVATHPDLRRVVVAVDPSGSSGADQGDQQGIVVAGLGVDGRGYVLADRTCRLSPEGWGRRAIAAFDDFGADRIVAEKNYGGDMVRFTIHTVRPTAPVSLVNASRGKIVRAEPIAALYKQSRIKPLIPDLADNPWPNWKKNCATRPPPAGSAKAPPTAWTPWCGR